MSMYSPDDLLFLTPDQSIFESAVGEFARQVLVISLADPVAAANNRNFLTKVLSAARLNLDQDALFVELPTGKPVGLLLDTRRKKPDHILVFGVPASQLGLNMSILAYQPFLFQQMTFLFADALPVLEMDQGKKGELWTALKTMFL
ncbi:MAG: hypothetical protein ABIQ93_16375 [Saprospiraceae bacterium]